MLALTSSLSPVSSLTVMPCAASACKAGAADSLGGSRKAIVPISVSPHSSATE
jgi:hypothetical protein